jgi:hypothetical protein
MNAVPSHARGAVAGLARNIFTGILAGALCGALSALSGFPLIAQAGHSVPNPKAYWNCRPDDGSAPDESCLRITKAGNGWDASRKARFDAAVSVWSTNTDFDPQLGTQNLRQAFVDRHPPQNCGGNFDPTEFAVTCVLFDYSPATYDRVADADVYFNTTGWVWNVNLAADLTKVDFYGVSVHELGHFLFLRDLLGGECGPVGDRHTMCGAVTKAETHQLRTLGADDINAANSVY